MKSSLSSLLSLLLLLTLAHSWCYKSYFTVPGDCNVIDISPDSAYMAVTAVSQNAVYVYDIVNNNLLLNYTPSGTVVAARFTKDGVYLGIATNSGGNSAVWLLSGRATFNSSVLLNFAFAGKNIADIDFNQNSTKMLVCSSNAGRYDIVSNYSGTSSTAGVTFSNNIVKCRFSMNDDVGFVDNNKCAKVYRPAGTISTSITTASANYKNFDIRMTAATPIKFIAAGSDTKNYYATDTNPGSMSANSYSLTSTLSNGVMTATCYSGDAQFYASAGGGSDERIFIYADNDSLYQVFSEPTLSHLSCRFTPDGSYLYFGTAASSGYSNVYVYKKNCFECPLGYYLSGTTTCNLCNQAASMLFCASCVNSTSCTSCVPGYYLNQTSQQCYKCDYLMEGCSTCANATYCYECNSNYLISITNRTCQTCASNHTGCLTCNSTTCLTCTEEYYLLAGVCTRCNGSKANCLRCSPTGSCVQCTFGFYSSGGNCLSCNANCQFCYNSATNCSACVRGYYSLSLACTACTTDCLDCNSTNHCFDCRTGTYLTATGTCSLCAYPCDTCNSTNCLSCVTGTYLSGTTCLPCALNCSVCVSSANCSACSLGSYLTAGNLCLSCHYLFPNCTACNLTQCFSCEVGYYFSGTNTCLTCAASGCIACNSSSLCQTCAVGYYLTATSSCAQCNLYCDTCYVSSTNCSSCIPGYYLSSGSCLSCSSNCQTCNGTTCFSCTNSYYLTLGACSSCKTAIYGCIDCMNSTYCKGCQVGKYLTSASLCAECPSSCGSCNSSQCMSCNLGYYISSGSCYKCADNCSECYSASNCYSCNPGFYYNSGAASLQCTSCWSLFRGCLTCNSTACFTCQFGTYLDSGTKTCITCKTAMPNCLYCESSSYCQLCSQGYYLNAANNSCTTCVSAIEGCQACSGSGQCLTCSLGYYLNGNVCTVCSSKCLTCNSTGCLACAFRYVYNVTDCVSCSSIIPHCDICNTAATCLRCFQGFYLSSGACVACESQLVGCSFCNSSAVCTSCMEGFYLSAGNTCTLCSTAEGCLLCSSSSVCTDCATGYVLSTTTCVLCSSLLSNCIYCSNSTTCLQCTAGYYLNGAVCSSCGSALSECIYCSSGTQCTKCEGGFYLNGLVCASCVVTGCETCSALAPTQCVNCYSGYYILGNSCLSCNSTGCLDCTQANVCLSCEVGYYLSASACSLCSTAMSGCTKCSSSTVCTECQTLYYLSGSTCTPCSSTLVGCAFCTNSTACLSCNSGYYLNSSALCSLCTSLTGCLLCTDISTCIYCNSGYYLLAGVCNTCTNITYCSVCTNATTCTSCVSGYALSSSGACAVIQTSSGGSSSPTDTITNMKWTSYYVDSTTLKHVLQAVGMSYNRVNTTWSSNVKIAIGNKTATTALTIKSVEWGRPYELIFYTNNPLQFSMKSLPFVHRLLVGQSLQLNLNSSVEVSQSLMAQMLPNLLLTNALTMGYSLDDPQFYNSYISSVYNTYYYMIGIGITALLFLNFLIKAVCTVVHSNNHGNIIGHIFALKAVPISLYPTFGEYINYGYGFMTADLPWLNSWFGYLLSNDSDSTPLGYLLYYSNMNLFSTYVLPLGAFLLALGLAFMAFHQTDPKKFQLKRTQYREKASKFNSVTEFLLNFFYFGMVFAGCASLQGSILNPYNIISLNGVGYVLGIILYVVTLGLCLNSLHKDWSFSLLRLFVKGTLLSIAHYNPIYIFAVALTMDIMLVFIEMKVRYPFIINPSLFLISQLLVNFSLSIFFYLPDSLIAIYISAAAVCLAILIEIYLHYIERFIPAEEYPSFSKEKVAIGSQEVNWKINPHDYSLENESIAKGKEKELQLHEENDKEQENIFFNEPEVSTKYSTFKETSKKTDPKRRTRRFRDANKARTTMNSSWSSFQINEK